MPSIKTLCLCLATRMFYCKQYPIVTLKTDRSQDLCSGATIAFVLFCESRLVSSIYWQNSVRPVFILSKKERFYIYIFRQMYSNLRLDPARADELVWSAILINYSIYVVAPVLGERIPRYHLLSLGNSTMSALSRNWPWILDSYRLSIYPFIMMHINC